MIKLVKAKLNQRWELILPEHRAERPEWKELDGWEGPRLLSMSKNIGKGDVVYYVGAELGEMSALCAKWGADTVLFEPNYKSWPSIRKTYEANKLTKPLFNFFGFASNKVQLEPVKPDTQLNLDFKNAEDGWPVYSLDEIEPAHGFSELAFEADGLPQTTIDNVVYELGIKPPTVITFDCEGSDWEVLRGAERTLREHMPVIYASIHPEFMFNMFGEYSGDFRNWIKDFGYEEKLLDYQHECHFVYWPIGKELK